MADVDSVVSDALAELSKLQRKQRDLYASGEPGVFASGRAGPVAAIAPAAPPASAPVDGAPVTREEFAKFQDAFAKVNELNERIISQNVLLQAELEGLARQNAELRSEKAALALKLRRG